MTSSGYQTAPTATSAVPPGIPFIIANEGAERFSFYGMRAVLVLFMTQHLVGVDGALDTMGEAEAKGWFHLFVSAVYFTPLLGALISDGVLGKYRTIIFLSIVYCLGHATLALDHTRLVSSLAFRRMSVINSAEAISTCCRASSAGFISPSTWGLLFRCSPRPG
jgi:dipeptide/tripeptide permease